MSDDWSCLLFYLCICMYCIMDAVREFKSIYTHIRWARVQWFRHYKKQNPYSIFFLSLCIIGVDVISCVIHHHLYRSNFRFLVLSFCRHCYNLSSKRINYSISLSPFSFCLTYWTIFCLHELLRLFFLCNKPFKCL
jgi:hypothetical protein